MNTAFNHFQRLGLEPSYSIDPADLERRFHEQSRVDHPDRHAREDERARVKSALASAQLNEAYRTLRDPVKRAEYLLSLAGVPIADEKGGGAKVDPAFLMEILELREALADARAARDRATIDRLSEGVVARREAAMARIADGFLAADARGKDALADVAAALAALRYYRRFLDEIEAADEEHAAESAP